MDISRPCRSTKRLVASSCLIFDGTLRAHAGATPTLRRAWVGYTRSQYSTVRRHGKYDSIQKKQRILVSSRMGKAFPTFFSLEWNRGGMYMSTHRRPNDTELNCRS